MAWKNVGENPTWVGSLVPQTPRPVHITDHGDLGADEEATGAYQHRYEPPPHDIPDVDLDYPDHVKDRIRRHYQQHPPDNGEDTSNMTD